MMEQLPRRSRAEGIIEQDSVMSGQGRNLKNPVADLRMNSNANGWCGGVIEVNRKVP